MNVDLSQILDDCELQQQIDRAQEDLLNAPMEDRRVYWERFRDLINSRSPEEVARMERAKGLR